MRRYAALLIGVAVAAGCARLGFWQLSRLAERRELNQTIDARMRLPTVGLHPEGSPLTDSMIYRRVSLTGRPDYRREVVVVGRSHRGVPGVHVVTPILLGDGTAALVERLWLPSPDAATVDLAAAWGDSVVTLEGMLMPQGQPRPVSGDTFPIRVQSLNSDALAARFPYPVLRSVVRQTSTTTEGALVPLPELTDGPHLSYAIQWFAFGVIALAGSVALVVKQPPVDIRPSAA